MGRSQNFPEQTSARRTLRVYLLASIFDLNCILVWCRCASISLRSLEVAVNWTNNGKLSKVVLRNSIRKSGAYISKCLRYTFTNACIHEFTLVVKSYKKDSGENKGESQKRILVPQCRACWILRTSRKISEHWISGTSIPLVKQEYWSFFGKLLFYSKEQDYFFAMDKI